MKRAMLPFLAVLLLVGGGYCAFVLVQQPAGATGLGNGSVAWGDYDKDGDLDLAVNGYDGAGYRFRVYRNDGGTFNLVQEPAGATGPGDGAVAWGDYDNDGDLDLAVNGLDGSNFRFRIYRNDSGTFNLAQEPAGAVGPGWAGSVAWGDYDNDGDLDLVVNGASGGGEYRFQVYRNDGGTFNLAQEPAGTSGPWQGSSAWGDYDNDGDLDLAISAKDGTGERFRVYRNDGGTFNLAQEPAGATGPGEGGLAWGDYDNDGDLDLAVNGLDGVDYRFRVYRNDAGTFNLAQEPAGTTGPGSGGWVAWGDYDNDGDLDLAVNGFDGGNNRFRVYRNDAGTFNLAQEPAGATGPSGGGLAWGDYDNDGDLDLVVSGADVGYKFQVYRNDGVLANTAPTAPLSGFTAVGDPATQTVSLRWGAGSDSGTGATPTNGLSYVVRVSTQAGVYTNPNSLKVSWSTATPFLGNYPHGFVSSSPLQAGMNYKSAQVTTTFYWQVATVDAGLRSSAWSGEQSVYVNFAPPAVPTGLGTADVPADQGGVLRLSWVANTESDMKDYGVYRATLAGSSPAPTRLVARILMPGTTHQDGGLTPVTTYYYKITARNTGLNESGGSAEASAYPVDNLAPGTPIGLAASNTLGGATAGGLLSLTWTANTETDRKDYGVYRSTAAAQAVTAATRRAYIVDPGTTHYEVGLTNNTTYYYRLTARDVSLNESGGSVETSAYPADTPPAAPTGLAASGGVVVKLSWAANSEGDLKDYGVYKATTAGGVDAAPTRIQSPGTTHQASGLTEVTTYYYRITARDVSLNESGGSTEASALVGAYPPSGFTGTALSTSSIRWGWVDNSASETGYEVHTATHGVLASLGANTTTWDEAGLSANTAYSRHVMVLPGNIATSESGSVTRYTLANAPSGISVTGVTDNSVALSWTGNGGSKFRVERATDPGGSWGMVADLLTSAAYSDASAPAGATLWYRVVGYNGDSIATAPSSAVSAVTGGIPVASNFSAVALSTTSIRWSWTDNASTESGYEVQDQNHTVKAALGANVVSWDETGLVANTAYTRHVRVFNSGASAETGNVTRYTLPRVPTGVMVTSTGSYSVTLSWAGNGGTRFSVERAPDAGGAPGAWVAVRAWADGLTASPYTDEDLTHNTVYWYRVKGYNGEGVVNPTGSNQVSVRTVLDTVLPDPPGDLKVAPTTTGTTGGVAVISGKAEARAKIASMAVRDQAGTALTGVDVSSATVAADGTISGSINLDEIRRKYPVTAGVSVEIEVADRAGNVSAAGKSNLLTFAAPETKAEVYGNLLDPAQGQPMRVRYEVAQSAAVLIQVQDGEGRVVRTILESQRAPGVYADAAWDGKNGDGETVASGTYLVLIQTGDAVTRKKVVVVR